MNKYFLAGMLAFAIAFTIYNIVTTIRVRREIERNKKLRQEKYEQRLKELKKAGETKWNKTK